ncbi:hypothetical protein [Coprobacter fastidiosus]|uniref:hypothetical protein n=1 Tax=Coprobacter fastidiosus TaxID=1099853 RepID=UPI001D5B6317|nr:hypothetical protein [Coprobacter fastidiosus]HJF44130.1 DUF5074 domain-containing protein [Coprobacter fastidiosus]
MKKIIGLFFLISIQILSVSAEELTSGLFFNSHLHDGNKRTSLILDNGNPIEIQDKQQISFEMNIRDELIFGFAMRIITNNNENIDLIFSIDTLQRKRPAIVIKDKRFFISDTIIRNKWIPVGITFLTKQNKIELSYNSIKRVYDYDFNQIKNTRIYFGACDHPNYNTPDAAPINVKNIRIYNGKELFRHWELSQHGKGVCYDLVNHSPAKAINPHWLTDDHAVWKNIYNYQFKRNPQYAFDPEKELFYITTGGQEMFIYNPLTNHQDTIRGITGHPAAASTNQMIFNTKTNRLESYNLDDQTISIFSFTDKAWTQTSKNEKETGFWHHTSGIAPDSTIITFGGYGSFLYKNTLFKINPQTGEFTEKIIPEIYPRYSPASAIVDNTLYIFGGKGCPSGHQELSPRDFSDLYAIDLNSFETKKLWEVPNFDKKFLPGSNMVYNKEESCFYIITGNMGGVLLKISINEPGIIPVSEIQHFDSGADFSFSQLYHAPRSQHLYCLYAKNYKNGQPSQIQIYSLSYPPMVYSQILQQDKKKQDFSFLWYLIPAIILLVGTGIFIRKRGKNRKKDNKFSTSKSETDSLIFTVPDKPYFNRDRACICLLGSFNVKSKTGENITSSFTPILKSLLLLILLNTEKDNRGITSKKLDDLLWGDKNEKSARNNRNVSISRLRLLLEKVGNIQIVNDNNFWKIVLGDDVFCDYHTALNYIDEATKTTVHDEEFFNKVLELLLYGPLLPNTESDYLDSFKSHYSDITIDLLHLLLHKEEFQNNDKFRLKIADSIFQHDSFNEEALRIKCSIFCRNDKMGIAKSIYDNFCKEYQTLLGEKYGLSFNDVTKEE